MDESLVPAPVTDQAEHGVVDVLLPLALDQTYSYRQPAGLPCTTGSIVVVPLGTRETIGVVWGTDASASGNNLKPVSAVLDLPPLPDRLRQFLDWVATYTMAPRGMVARLALRDPRQDPPERPKVGVRLTGLALQRVTPARARVVAAAEGDLLWTKGQLARAAGVSAAIVDALVDAGVLEAVAMPKRAPAPGLCSAPDLDRLNPEQRAAAQRLIAAVGADKPDVHLLEGVTGSGKTEIYLEAVAAAVARGRQALVLVPEIALTAQFLARFERRFGQMPDEWHSGVASSRKTALWRAVALGEAKVVVGARSALFLPFADLGAIVVDEEHEQAYKQEDGVHYHARDMAVVRGRIESALVVLSSATPAIESRVNAESGRYAHLKVSNRFAGRQLPKLSAVDLRVHTPGHGRWLSPPLIAALQNTFAQGYQALLFLNRRGYAPLTLCHRCGHRWTCPNCSAWLVEHRFRRALVCHHCGHAERTPRHCTSCEAEDSIVACGPGVERLAEETAELFPGVRTVALSSDFPGGTERLRRELEAIASGEFQLIIGTQMVAKGHDFPGLALVGVVDADVGLANGDPRAAERMFQTLQQVTGRAGRGAVAGRGLVQTRDPEHPVMQALLSGDADAFYEEEIAMRRLAGLPPFGRLASLIVSGKDKNETEAHARALAHAGLQALSAADWSTTRLLGPAEAPLALLRGRHRFRLLVKAPRQVQLQAFIRTMLAASPKLRGSIRVSIDIDPMSFL